MVPESFSDMSSHDSFDLKQACYSLRKHWIPNPNNNDDFYRDNLDDSSVSLPEIWACNSDRNLQI